MYLEIIRHDGPGRLGKFDFNGGKFDTPSILWSQPAGGKPKGYLEITPIEETKEGCLAEYGTLFKENEIEAHGFLPSFPSGYNSPEKIAKEAVIKTLDLAKNYPEQGAVLEGGKYIELREMGADTLGNNPIIKIANSEELSKNHRKLVNTVTYLREKALPTTAIYMSGIHPSLFPLLVYMGVDFFDLKRGILDSHKKIYHTKYGGLSLQKFNELPCQCKNCQNADPKNMSQEALLSHNVGVWLASIIEVRESIRRGELRNLVEERAANNVVAMGALRILDAEKSDFLEKHTPIFNTYDRVGDIKSKTRFIE